MRLRLGVTGWPVAHSLSPAIHNAALRALGLDGGWRYQLLPIPPELFAETVRALPAAGFRGLNVTIPHKQSALALADRASSRAKAIGAANVLLFGDGGIEADNTDAPALIEVLPIAAKGASALVLGAGGSAHAAVWALLDAGAQEVLVWNRTAERAQELCRKLGGTPVRELKAADLLINCTSVGLDPRDHTLNQLPLDADDLRRYECVVDLVYINTDTPLIAAARERAIAFVDGRELLIAQGALSFKRFTGRQAPIEAMRAAARMR